jgi:nucleotide-binding universal stress UspA family protein
MASQLVTPRRIVVGVDESDGAADALRWAVDEAALDGAEVTAVMAWGFLDQHHTIVGERFDPAYSENDALAALEDYKVAAIGPDRAADAHARLICDLPGPALLDAAAQADLLVVGARGLGGFRGLLLGSVSQHCLHHASTPVAVIRGRREVRRSGRVVVAIDGSDTARGALRWALTEARRRDASIEVVHAWQTPYLPRIGDGFDTTSYETASRRLIADAVTTADTTGLTKPVREHSVHGGAVETILDMADGADLLVLGSRGLGGLKRLVLGSVATQVAHHAPCPVVVVPPTPATSTHVDDAAPTPAEA